MPEQTRYVLTFGCSGSAAAAACHLSIHLVISMFFSLNLYTYFVCCYYNLLVPLYDTYNGCIIMQGLLSHTHYIIQLYIAYKDVRIFSVYHIFMMLEFWSSSYFDVWGIYELSWYSITRFVEINILLSHAQKQRFRGFC